MVANSKGLEVCMVCGRVLRIVNRTHLGPIHNMTVEEYDDRYERKYIPMRPMKHWEKEYVDISNS